MSSMSSSKQSRLSPEAQARVDFVNSIVPKANQKHRRWLIALPFIVLVFIVLVLTMSGGQSKPKQSIVAKPQLPTATNLEASGPTKIYSSSNFNMSLAYPEAWILQYNKTSLIISSPLVNLISAGGNGVKGHVVLSVVKAGVFPTALTAGTDLAVLDSAVVNYTQPSSNQSGQTYVSFIQYSTTNVVGGLDSVYVTGNMGYLKDQVIAPTDLTSLDPLIYFTFNSCNGNTCKTLSPLTIASASWSGSPLGQIVSAIIQSMVFN
ncbi:MAG TPA: hypothetical protein VFN31_02545 [Candidatus Saccharimonadales bacterium]|nr:hypothetical protein [Candidatus Saccharimonadales bacterium]